MSNTKKGNKMPVKVGDEIIVEPTSSLCRIYGKKPRKAIVKKIGKKYFYADIEEVCGEFDGLTKFDLEMHGSSVYLSNWVAYHNLKEMEDEKERLLLLKDLRDFFDYPNNSEKLNLEQVRQIKSIIGDIG